MRLLSTLLILLPFALAHPLLLRVPAHISALPSSTRAILTTKNHTLRAPITRSNTFLFNSKDLLPLSSTTKTGKAEIVSYLLDIACRDYDFASYGLDVSAEADGLMMEVYRVARGGIEVGGREEVGSEGVEVRMLKTREFYEGRAGCKSLCFASLERGKRWRIYNEERGDKRCEGMLANFWCCSFANGFVEESNDIDCGGWVGVCVWDALSHGQQYVISTTHMLRALPSPCCLLYTEPLADLVLCTSGPGDEEGI